MSEAPVPGARRAAKPRRAAQPRRFRGDPTVPAAFVLLLLAALAVALTVGSGAHGRPAATEVGDLVDHQVLACPSADAPGDVATRFAAGVVGAPGLGSGGSVRQGPATDSGTNLDLQRGQLLDLAGTTSAAVLTGTGQLAAGLMGFRVDSSSRADTLATTPCQGPRASWWFTGAGAGLDHASELTLANVDAGPAVVDLRVLGPDGQVETVNTRGITIAPGAERTVPLTEVAPQTDELALEVQASRGRVLASVSDGFAAQAGAPKGREWLSGDVGPSRVVRLAGLPEQADGRTLLIANPSDSAAVVDVQVAGRSGRFVPAGLDTQTVAPGSVASVRLDPSVGKREAVALRLRSQVPILATVRSVSGNDATDTAQVLPLAGPAAAPVIPGQRATVQLTAGDRKAQADVTAYDARGNEVGKGTVRVPAEATAAWTLHKKAAYLVVTPLSGSVHGAVVYQGTGVAAYPLTPLPIRLEQPAVNPAVR